MSADREAIGAWFLGPKAENGEAFAATVRRILEDYHYWRRNYFPEDGLVVDAHTRRHQEEFQDRFEDKLLELLAALKADFPFYSPRYAGHMLSEQTMPSVAGYFAGMLFNPNNVTLEAAPVTTRLELEAASMIARMLGYGSESWAHLTSGGTIANLEALWIARSVLFLPWVVRDMAERLGVRSSLDLDPFRATPDETLSAFEEIFDSVAEEQGASGAAERAIAAYRSSPYNVVERGLAEVSHLTGVRPLVFAPQTQHYCIAKAVELMGLGRGAIVPVQVDGRFRMDVRDLAKKLDEAERAGCRALAVVVVVGTTEEGAVDPVHRVLELRHDRRARGKPCFWLHADAAYGGYLRTITLPFRLGLGEPNTTVRVGADTFDIGIEFPEGVCDALDRLGECDSIVVDPHKLGYTPYPAGAICFKNAAVKAIARQHAAYLEEPPKGPKEERASQTIGVYILEGSRPGAAGASVWLSHSLIPLDHSGHGLLVQETVRNACELRHLLERWPEFAGPQKAVAQVMCPPDSNIVCFAFRPTSERWALADLNALNRRVYKRFTILPEEDERVYAQKFFVSRTVLSAERYSSECLSDFLERLGVTKDEYDAEGVFVLRCVLMSPWYTLAKRRNRFYLSELVAELYREACAQMTGFAPSEKTAMLGD